ncbi:hypothetical protein [Streptomyces glaucus]|uniref:RING-type domain-containing protein n=1 Tax=Streptomyces glaucus TaxID=284029 RepID=A0ABN3J2K4_9ACTN
MATDPSDEEFLQAVEEHVFGRGGTVRLTLPGAAALDRQQLLDARIVRCIETRETRDRRVPGLRRAEIAERPACTDLAAHPVDPPDDPARSRTLTLVRAGSLDEIVCEGCEGGTRDCEACGGRGGRDCPRYVDCDVCEGGPDACWECDGTGTPRTRGAARAARPRPQDAAKRATCARCERPEVACPKCLGRRHLDCPVCDRSGRVPCRGCGGRERIRHTPCAGTGHFTVWTEGIIRHTPDAKEVKRLAPLVVRMPTDATGDWRETRLTSVTDKLPDDLDPAHRALLEPELAVRDGEVRRRVTVRRLPLARVTVRDDPHRVYYAFPVRSGGIDVVGLPSRQRVLHVTARASAALVLLALAAALVVALSR